MRQTSNGGLTATHHRTSMPPASLPTFKHITTIQGISSLISDRIHCPTRGHHSHRRHHGPRDHSRRSYYQQQRAWAPRHPRKHQRSSPQTPFTSAIPSRTPFLPHKYHKMRHRHLRRRRRCASRCRRPRAIRRHPIYRRGQIAVVGVAASRGGRVRTCQRSRCCARVRARCIMCG